MIVDNYYGTNNTTNYIENQYFVKKFSGVLVFGIKISAKLSDDN